MDYKFVKDRLKNFFEKKGFISKSKKFIKVDSERIIEFKIRKHSKYDAILVEYGITLLYVANSNSFKYHFYGSVNRILHFKLGQLVQQKL